METTNVCLENHFHHHSVSHLCSPWLLTLCVCMSQMCLSRPIWSVHAKLQPSKWHLNFFSVNHKTWVFQYTLGIFGVHAYVKYKKSDIVKLSQEFLGKEVSWLVTMHVRVIDHGRCLHILVLNMCMKFHCSTINTPWQDVTRERALMPTGMPTKGWPE